MISKEIELKIFLYQFSLADSLPITGHVMFSRELFVYHLTIIYSYARHNLKIGKERSQEYHHMVEIEQQTTQATKQVCLK